MPAEDEASLPSSITTGLQSDSRLRLPVPSALGAALVDQADGADLDLAFRHPRAIEAARIALRAARGRARDPRPCSRHPRI